RIREEAERVKKELSSASTAEMNLPFITATKEGGKHLKMSFNRAKFDELTYDLVERTAIPVKNALQDAGIDASQLGKVLMVGGSTRVPSVQEKVQQLTGQIPSRNLNPDECVALGAAIQGGKLAGEEGLHAVLLMDVTPLSLSIETVGGVATRLMERNSTIPTRYSQVFSTAGDFQTTVEIKVLQGERPMARDNKLIGNFKLKGIKRAPRGVPQIEVTFDIDVNGILKVSAKDLGNGKEQHITITANSNMSEADIEQAMNDAVQYESLDRDKTSSLDTLKDAQTILYQAEQGLTKKKKEMGKEEKIQIKAEVKTLRRLVGKAKPESVTLQDAQQIKESKERLENLMSGWDLS
ncbi:MAG: Hsp70 family protein, partial [Lachnospiraceae bacterium]